MTRNHRAENVNIFICCYTAEATSTQDYNTDIISTWKPRTYLPQLNPFGLAHILKPVLMSQLVTYLTMSSTHQWEKKLQDAVHFAKQHPVKSFLSEHSKDQKNWLYSRESLIPMLCNLFNPYHPYR